MLCMNWQVRFYPHFVLRLWYSIQTQKTHYTKSTTNNHAPRCM